MSKKLDKISPFPDNPIMIGYDNRLFSFDDALGYKFAKNQIIGESGFIGLNDKISELKKRKGRFLILNFGDSATSGWNSDKVYKGCPNPLAALFSYKTYSDLLKEKYGVDTINAGVPGYTTYQAKKYLGAILKKLSQNQIYVDYVTTYLGNNDCTFNGLEDKVRIDYKIDSESEIITRVSKDDYIENYNEIAKTVASYGANLIILLPASNYKWEPGLRSSYYPNERNEQLHKLTNQKVRALFEESNKAYQLGDYELALEKDLLLPRIKLDYKTSLKLFASEKGIIQIDSQNFVKSERDFVDYCHPNEQLNGRIAEAINSFLKSKNIGCPPNIFQENLPLDTYTLY